MPLSGPEGGTSLHHFTAASRHPHCPWHTDRRSRSRELCREEGELRAHARRSCQCPAALRPPPRGTALHRAGPGPRPAQRVPEDPAARRPPLAPTLAPTAASSARLAPALRLQCPSARAVPALRSPSLGGADLRPRPPGQVARTCVFAEGGRAEPGTSMGPRGPPAGPSAGSEPLTRGAPRPRSVASRTSTSRTSARGREDLPGQWAPLSGQPPHRAGQRSHASRRVTGRRTGIGCSHCGVTSARPARVSLATQCAGAVGGGGQRRLAAGAPGGAAAWETEEGAHVTAAGREGVGRGGRAQGRRPGARAAAQWLGRGPGSAPFPGRHSFHRRQAAPGGAPRGAGGAEASDPTLLVFPEEAAAELAF